MKVNTLLIATVLLCFTFNGFTQAGNNMSGKWVVNIEKTLNSIASEKKNKYDSMNLAKRTQIYDSFKDRVFHLKDGGVAVISFSLKGSLKEIQGKWTYDPSTDQLIIDINNNPNIYTIVWISSNESKMVFSSKSPDGLFNLLVLERKN